MLCEEPVSPSCPRGAEAGSAIASILSSARSRGVFSAASWCIGRGDVVVETGSLGTAAGPGYTGEHEAIDETWLFDLASVTKPMVAVAVLRLAARGAVDLTVPAAEWVPDLRGQPLGQARLDELLAHIAGAPGPTPLFRQCSTANDLLAANAALPMGMRGRWCYSSMGYIVLGRVAESASAMPLDELVAAEITDLCGMRATSYRPSEPLRCVATEDDRWRGRLVRGEVHDENAAVLGSVAGHAGLFGTATDLGSFAAAVVGDRLLPPSVRIGMERGLPSDVGLAPLGWWPASRSGFLSESAPAGTYGHTGFTGTSVAISPRTGEWVCLLTNRVHPTRDDRGFAAVRTEVHRSAWEHLAARRRG